MPSASASRAKHHPGDPPRSTVRLSAKGDAGCRTAWQGARFCGSDCRFAGRSLTARARVRHRSASRARSRTKSPAAARSATAADASRKARPVTYPGDGHAMQTRFDQALTPMPMISRDRPSDTAWHPSHRSTVLLLDEGGDGLAWTPIGAMRLSGSPRHRPPPRAPLCPQFRPPRGAQPSGGQSCRDPLRDRAA
jgi:hypothetical protein